MGDNRIKQIVLGILLAIGFLAIAARVTHHSREAQIEATRDAYFNGQLTREQAARIVGTAVESWPERPRADDPLYRE